MFDYVNKYSVRNASYQLSNQPITTAKISVANRFQNYNVSGYFTL